MNEPVVVQFQPSFWLSYRVSLRLVAFSPLSMLISAVFPVGGLYLIYLYLQHGHVPTAWESLTIVWCLLFTPIITAFSLFMIRHRNRLVGNAIGYKFEDAGIHISTAATDSTVKWTAIGRVVETPRVMFFFFAPVRAFYVPLDVLQSGGQLQALRNIVGNHVAKLKGPAWKG